MSELPKKRVWDTDKVRRYVLPLTLPSQSSTEGEEEEEEPCCKNWIRKFEEKIATAARLCLGRQDERSIRLMKNQLEIASKVRGLASETSLSSISLNADNFLQYTVVTSEGKIATGVLGKAKENPVQPLTRVTRLVLYPTSATIVLEDYDNPSDYARGVCYVNLAVSLVEGFQPESFALAHSRAAEQANEGADPDSAGARMAEMNKLREEGLRKKRAALASKDLDEEQEGFLAQAPHTPPLSSKKRNVTQPGAPIKRPRS
jgi:hypothetical protein